MSLRERVELAQGRVDPRSEKPGFLLLRRQVQEILPPEKLAAMTEESPLRARSEVMRACMRAFDGPEWVLVGEGERSALAGEVVDSVFGFGPLEELLSDPTVTEVMVNGPSRVFFEREGKLHPSSQKFASEDQLRALIDRILGPLGRRVDEASPMVNARLPQGHRVHVVMPPLSLVGPVLTIRKFSERVYTLDDLAEMGALDGEMRVFLTWSILMRKNIAVSGGTGSGKTTLLNAMSCEIPPDERIITIEDSAELRFLEHPHVVSLEARPENSEGRGLVTIRDLVINALRMRPDRIVVGECRGAEALDMLQAMSTGHDGSLTTLHANSPEEVVSRLTTMVRYSADLPVDVVEANVASALDLVVQTSRAPDGSRFVSQVSEIGYSLEQRQCVLSTLFKRGVLDKAGVWVGEPRWLEGVVDFGFGTTEEVEEWRSRAFCSQ